MRREYLIGGLITLAVVALLTWIARNTYWEQYAAVSPLKGEALTNPFYEGERLVALLGAHAELRHEITSMPPTNAAIVLGHWNWSIVPERRQRLERWVNDGGRLVISFNYLRDKQFDAWTGVTSIGPHPNHETYVIPEDHSKTRWGACTLHLNYYLASTKKTSWRIMDSNSNPQAVRVPIGKGSVTVVNDDTLPGETLLDCDDAQLFTAYLQLRPGDRIIFLTQSGGDSLLSLMWRYGSPVIVLLCLLIVLWLWRSGVRFGPLIAVPDSSRRSLAEQVRGTGQFVARFGGGRSLHAATVRALDEAAARRVPQYASLSDESRITTLAPLTGYGPAELLAALNPAVSHNSQDLRKAIAVLELARRHITQNNLSKGS